ncbi:cellulose biosynthesis protein BcsP [Undibacterium sp. SXout11W]|uniref:cellulose biosynthesis protein BcsP n=1 Tax=Undibacterium sp. SXout11W TaxID=3413050 RepID=UPI003BF40825
MNDDVKNLFQKFGQTTNSYQEINRDIDSEQAKQRWPLLRDVRVHEAPEDMSHDVEDAGISVMSQPAVIDESLLSQPSFIQVNGAALHSAPSLHSTPPVAPSAPPPVVPAFAESFEAGKPLFAAKLATPPHAENRVTNLFSARPAVPGLANASPSTSKSHSVSEVFRRLANQDQQSQKVETPVNSFFKKIFRP